MDKTVSVEAVVTQAQPVLDAFYDAVVACGFTPPLKPSIHVASPAGATLYDPASRAVVLVPYEVLPPARRAAMDRFAAIGTLGLSGVTTPNVKNRTVRLCCANLLPAKRQSQ